MYSSHTIDSVTCLRLSSRCTAAQSGSARRRWPCRLPLPAFAKSRAPSTVSVTSSGNGQLSPDASNRRIVSRTVEGAVPTRRAISRLGIPADFNLITSRTWRIASLSVGIQVPLRKAERRDRSGTRRGRVTPGDIIPEWWARSSRNGGRDHLGMAGDIKSERWARSFRNSGRHRAESANCLVAIDKLPGFRSLHERLMGKEFVRRLGSPVLPDIVRACDELSTHRSDATCDEVRVAGIAHAYRTIETFA